MLNINYIFNYLIRYGEPFDYRNSPVRLGRTEPDICDKKKARMKSSRFFSRSSLSPSPCKPLEGCIDEENRKENRKIEKATKGAEVVNTDSSSSEKNKKLPSGSRKSSPFFGKRKNLKSRMSGPPLLKCKDTCAICLGVAENAAGLDKCTHIFCLECISQWALVKLSCPYCKADFRVAKCLGADGKSIRFETPAPPANEDDYGYFFEGGEEDEDDELDYDYVPGQDDQNYGYVSDGGFVVNSDDDLADRYDQYDEEEENEEELLSGDEEILTGVRLSRRDRRMRRRRNRVDPGAGGAVVDLRSPEECEVVDLVTPPLDEGDSENQRENPSPVDLIGKFSYNEENK